MPTLGTGVLAGCAEASNPEERLVTHHLLSPCQPLLPMAAAPPPVKFEIWPVGGGHVDRVKWTLGNIYTTGNGSCSWPAPLLNSDNRPKPGAQETTHWAHWVHIVGLHCGFNWIEPKGIPGVLAHSFANNRL